MQHFCGRSPARSGAPIVVLTVDKTSCLEHTVNVHIFSSRCAVHYGRLSRELPETNKSTQNSGNMMTCSTVEQTNIRTGKN